MARAELFVCAFLVMFGNIAAISTRHVNYKECLQDDALITTIIALSLQQCLEECAMRISCLSLNYRREVYLCEIYSVTTGIFVGNVRFTGDCLHILRQDILEPEYPANCACTNGQTCIPDSSACEIRECPNLDIPRGVVYGNKKSIGSRLLVKCDPVRLGASNRPYGVHCQSNGAWNYTPTCPEYQGCYSDNHARALLPHDGIFNDLMTLQMCFNHCNGYNYAGAQSEDECYCGDTLDESLQRPESECSAPCFGDFTQTCGGSWRGSVYKLV
ncbi:hypothetical protein ACF0H5_021731 [Mactra antiquata]